MVEVFPFILGTLLVMIVDIFWWQIDFKKVERGLEAHEHYHVGLELIIAAMFVSLLHEGGASFLYGAGFLFIAAEWRQAVEILGNKVKAGHPFAYGSVHFKSSSIIGAVLVLLSLLSYLYVVPLVEGLL